MVECQGKFRTLNEKLQLEVDRRYKAQQERIVELCKMNNDDIKQLIDLSLF